MLGKDRTAFSYRYCNRRLIPVGRQGSNTKKYDNSGLSRAGELHALLKEVWPPAMAHNLLSPSQETFCFHMLCRKNTIYPHMLLPHVVQEMLCACMLKCHTGSGLG